MRQVIKQLLVLIQASVAVKDFRGAVELLRSFNSTGNWQAWGRRAKITQQSCRDIAAEQLSQDVWDSGAVPALPDGHLSPLAFLALVLYLQRKRPPHTHFHCISTCSHKARQINEILRLHSTRQKTAGLQQNQQTGPAHRKDCKVIRGKVVSMHCKGKGETRTALSREILQLYWHELVRKWQGQLFMRWRWQHFSGD